MASRLNENAPMVLFAAAVGVGTAIAGGAVPLAGLIGGLAAEFLKPQVPVIGRYDKPIQGIVDGSAALLAFGLFERPIGHGVLYQVAPQVAEDDSGALVG